MDNMYKTQQPVQLRDPSGRLGASGLNTIQFPYTPTSTVHAPLMESMRRGERGKAARATELRGGVPALHEGGQRSLRARRRRGLRCLLLWRGRRLELLQLGASVQEPL